jgi:hypothetical protein
MCYALNTLNIQQHRCDNLESRNAFIVSYGKLLMNERKFRPHSCDFSDKGLSADVSDFA